jgi:hypothetical protein
MDEDAQVEAVEVVLNSIPEKSILNHLWAELERLQKLKQMLELI